MIPKLYTHLKLAISNEEGTLMSLEGLIASRGDSLRHTIAIEVLPCHSNVADGSFRRIVADELSSRASALPTPQLTASHFNLLLRMLLRKIPSNQLSVFWLVQGLISLYLISIHHPLSSWSGTKRMASHHSNLSAQAIESSSFASSLIQRHQLSSPASYS